MLIQSFNIDNCVINFDLPQNKEIFEGKRLVEGIFSVIPPYQFLPAYKGPKKPVSFATSYKNIVVFRNGLLPYLMDALKNTVSVELDPQLYNNNKNLAINQHLVNIDELGEWCEEFYSESKYKPRDYQLNAACQVLNRRKSVSEICTRAGKTLITHIIFSYIIDYRKKFLNKSTKCLMIVPSKLLSTQGEDDFISYNESTKCKSIQNDKRWSSSKDEYKDKNKVLRTIIDENDILITTYQTWTKYSHEMSKLFDVCFCDECHNCSSNSYTNIFADLRPDCTLFGMTGSLPDDIVAKLTIYQSINYVTNRIESVDLQEEGFLCHLNVYMHNCNYYINNKDSDDYKYIEDAIKIGSKLLMYKDNKGEMHYPAYLLPLLSSPDRVNLYKTICEHINITKKESGNAALLLRYEQALARKINKKNNIIYNIIRKTIDTNSNATFLILCIHVDYTVELYNELCEMYKDSKVRVWRITGSVKPKERTEILNTVNSKKCDDNIVDVIVGSYGTMSTGVTIPYLTDVILGEGMASSICNIQSIGRALGKYEGKSEANIHDITDVFPTKLLKNHRKIRLENYTKMKSTIHNVSPVDDK